MRTRACAAVFAADAFHWFDERLAMPEIKRVLRPGGGVAILRTAPVIDEPWSRELGEIIKTMRPEHPAFNERGPAAALEEDPAFGPVRETTVDLAARARPRRAASRWWRASAGWRRCRTPSASGCSRASARVLDAHGFERASYDVLHQVWLARLR